MTRHRSIPARVLAAPFLVVLLAGSGFAQAPIYPGAAWSRAASPEQLGWSSDRLKEAKAYAATINTDALMIIVDGTILEEWGATAKGFNVHSIRKSFLSALYGIQVRDGRIQLSRTLADLGIDDTGSLSPAEKKATVADLLKARSGIYHPALYETPEMAMARPARNSYSPGTFWYYNNWDFNALGTIYEQATKASIFAEFKSRIADPLEMEDFRVEDGSYVRGPESVHAAYPFRMTARDMARFGLLYLRGGQWRGRSVVPREWVEESTRSFSDLGQFGGYGYLWWVAPNGGPHISSANFKAGSSPRVAWAVTSSWSSPTWTWSWSIGSTRT